MGEVKAPTDTEGEGNLKNGVKSPPASKTILMLAGPLLPAKGHL